MLKHISILGDAPKVAQKLRKQVLDSGGTFSEDAPGQPVLPHAAAVIPPDASPDLLQAALTLAGRHQSLLFLLAEAIDCREGLAPGSSVRIVEHASRFAEALGLADADRLTLERAALLRDIGKLRIPNAVLLKSDLLTYDEWAAIQNHANLGGDLAAETDGLQDLEEIIRCHHESYDGDGYPRRLDGDQIPFLARVLKIVDVYCAMTSPRHYRSGVASHQEALTHLKAERGKHFDPELVDVFLEGKIGQPPARVKAKAVPAKKPKAKPVATRKANSRLTKDRKTKKRS